MDTQEHWKSMDLILWASCSKPAFGFTGNFFFPSSGETVTSVTSLAPLQPKKGKRRKEKADVPPAVPAKGRRRMSRCPPGNHRDQGGGGLGMR